MATFRLVLPMMTIIRLVHSTARIAHRRWNTWGSIPWVSAGEVGVDGGVVTAGSLRSGAPADPTTPDPAGAMVDGEIS
jgi:hypothetical protein